MTAHHPWIKCSPEKVKPKLDAVSFDASGLWHAIHLHVGYEGGDGTIRRDRLPLATARRLNARKIGPLVDELLAEGLLESVDAVTLRIVPWEQPPVEVWTDEVLRWRWTRNNRLRNMTDLRNRIKERDRSLCRYCGIRVNWTNKVGRDGATYDHIDPDLDNTLDNVCVACRRCNGRKRDRTPEQAGMPLYRPGTTEAAIAAGQGRVLRAASAVTDRSPDQVDEEVTGPDQQQHAPPGQHGVNTVSTPHANSARARPRDRTGPTPGQPAPHLPDQGSTVMPEHEQPADERMFEHAATPPEPFYARQEF